MQTMIDKIKVLTYELNHASDEYYNKNNSIMSDEEWDEKFTLLKQMEKETGIQFADSPTINVGYIVKSELETVKHTHPMLSLDKTKDINEFENFAKKHPSVLMWKADGLTCTLKYIDGVLISAETRGDGEKGEDVIHTVKTICNIPHRIPTTEHIVEIDGEVIICKTEFERINEELKAKGMKPYKHVRNLAAGTLRQLNSEIASQRKLEFVAWAGITGFDSNSHIEILKQIQEMGFTTVMYAMYDEKTFVNDVENFKDSAKSSHIPIDGLVLKYDDIAYGLSLGHTEHHFRHSYVLKFYEDDEKTILRNIEWTMGRTGQLTPTAIFDTVEIDGTAVSRASVHNISICKKLQLGIGDEITVIKAQEIIPQIRENLTRSNTFEIPNHCPVCGEPTTIKKDNDTEVLICTNANCKGKLLSRLTHFVSKPAMNIDGLSEATLQKFIELGWVNNPIDIFDIKEYSDQLKKIDGFGEKSVNKLLINIEESKNISLTNFIVALNIPLIGKTAAKVITKLCKNNIDNFTDKLNTNYDWTQIDGFGEEMKNSIHNWYNSDDGHIEYWNMISCCNVITNTEGVDTQGVNSNVLEGKTFCITGGLNQYKNRDSLIQEIENHGGAVVSGVSKKTTYLINNDKMSTSSKNKKANELNIPILSEVDFIELIGGKK